MSSTPGSGKATRVLACVLCQHRKIKCDRNTPCSNCIKANVTCTPSTPAPARKRRRPNQDLQERLARCEQLLKQYADGSVPSPMATASQSPAMNGSLPDAPVSTPTNSESQSRWKPVGKMVKDEGGVRFMDSYLWASIHDELQAMREIVDTDDAEESSALSSEETTPDYNADLILPADISYRDIGSYQPDPVHTFRLWQLFMDRVNPLIKIVHIPSVQPYVMEAATNIENVPLNYQALLFAAFTMATVSLSESEANQILGCSREEALRKYTMGTKVALTKFNFLKNYDMIILQALLLYLFSLQNRYDRHAAWILSGMIVRIAQKMGYHRDGEALGLPPFETEMRRRMWWHIILQDAKNAMVSGLSHSMLPSSWDTKMPLNLNDADLFIGSLEPLKPHEGPTEMAFCLIGYQIAKFIVNAESLHGTPGMEAAILGHDKDPDDDSSIMPSIEKYRELADALDRDMMEVEERYIDASAGSVHLAALTIRPMITSKIREMLVPMRQQPEWGTEIFDQKDNLFKVVLMNNEHTTATYEVMDRTGFLWFTKLHFQIDIFTVMTAQLCQRPTGSLSDRAWGLIERTYRFHTELYDMTNKACLTQAQLTLKAWKAREQAFLRAGQAIELPSFIYRLRECTNESRSSEPPTLHPVVQPPATNAPMTDLDQFLGGYLDVSALNWDMWGNSIPLQNMQNMQSNDSPAMFGAFGMGGIN